MCSAVRLSAHPYDYSSKNPAIIPPITIARLPTTLPDAAPVQTLTLLDGSALHELQLSLFVALVSAAVVLVHAEASTVFVNQAQLSTLMDSSLIGMVTVTVAHGFPQPYAHMDVVVVNPLGQPSLSTGHT